VVQLLLEDIVCSRMEVLQNLSLIISMLILQKCANVNQYMIGVTMEKKYTCVEGNDRTIYFHAKHNIRWCDVK
jgi:hypothetical protein